MAGDWIKMRKDLHEDPAVVAVATCLGLDEYAVVGRLHRLWGWADAQSRSGHAPVTQMFIDVTLCRCEGFAEALVSVGWLSVENDGIAFPKFDRHMSQSAKKRALARDRQRHARVTKKSRAGRDKNVTREEKRRDERQPPTPPERGEATPQSGDPGRGGTSASPREEGTNPREVGTNPRATGANPRATGTNPRALGTNPRATSDAEPDHPELDAAWRSFVEQAHAGAYFQNPAAVAKKLRANPRISHPRDAGYTWFRDPEDLQVDERRREALRALLAFEGQTTAIGRIDDMGFMTPDGFVLFGDLATERLEALLAELGAKP